MLLTEDAPSPHHPLGLKGAGEGGINGVGGVIASAIDDAIGIPGAHDATAGARRSGYAGCCRTKAAS